MKKFLVAMGLVAFAVVGCDDSSSASAENNEPTTLSSAEEQVSSSSSVILSSSEGSSDSRSSDSKDEFSSSNKVESSSSGAQSDAKRSSSSEKFGKSSSSENESSSSSVKQESTEKSSSSEKLSETSSSSADKVASSSSSVTLAMPCKTETEDNCEYGTLLDERDGQTYKIVKIGDQWWMAENLNFETENSLCGGGESRSTTGGDCATYGRLYTWAAAIDSVKLATDAENPMVCGYGKYCRLSGKVQGICPEGWHLPDTTEWKTLFTAMGGSSTAGAKLKSQTGWTAYDGITNEDSFGFSALPAGGRDDSGDYYYESYHAYFWSSTENGSSRAYDIYLYYDYDFAYLDTIDKSYGFSVRCVKD